MGIVVLAFYLFAAVGPGGLGVFEKTRFTRSFG